MDDIQQIANIENLKNVEEGQFQRNNRFEKTDPFEVLSEHHFIQYFRLSKELCRYLINIVEPFMRPQKRTTDLSIETRVLVALRFFSCGSYQMDIAKSIFMTVSQSTVSQSIKEVSVALNQPEIFNLWVSFPRNFEELNAVRLKFHEDLNFPGVIGCVDCTHVAIFTPKINDEEFPENIYVNRKGYHSINVQLICDSKMKILNVNARYPGSTNDAFIWTNSNIQNILRNLHTRGHSSYYLLVSDSGYPLRTWLVTPLEVEPAQNTPEHNYNVAHKRTRNVIERCNGLLKMRFRCLLKDRVLHYKPDVACRIINASVVLHNMCLEYNVLNPEDKLPVNLVDFGILNNIDPENNVDNNLRRVNPELAAGRYKRNQIIHNVLRNN